jgi:hypothetical protein
MSAYCFFDNLEVTDPAKLEEYKSRVAPVASLPLVHNMAYHLTDLITRGVFGEEGVYASLKSQVLQIVPMRVGDDFERVMTMTSQRSDSSNPPSLGLFSACEGGRLWKEDKIHKHYTRLCLADATW